MQVAYLRSSSIGTLKMCELDLYASYTLGLEKKPSPSNTAGNVVHKALEMLARRKQCQQQGLKAFVDPESGREFRPELVTPDAAFDHGWDVYVGSKAHSFTFKPYQIRALRKQVDDVLKSDFSPLKHDVVQPEQFFDLPVEEPWALYEWTDPHTGDLVKGRLAIKGTMDLLVREPSGVLHLIDWKTGARKNWRTRRPKSLECLHDDDQLLLYRWALSKLYPNEPDIPVTIYYTKADRQQDIYGPQTLLYTREFVAKATTMLKERFEAMLSIQVPERAADDPTLAEKPCTFCEWAKKPWPNTALSTCDYLHGQLQQLGMDAVTKLHGRSNAIQSYGSGGGVSNRDAKEER